MKKFIKTLILLIVMNIVCVSAFAEALELNGKVTATQTETLSAPASGKITSVNVIPGDHIDAGAVLAEIQTSKVYAEQDGVIRVFGHPGDSVETLTARYGGVAYLEPKQRYTVSGST